LKSPLSIPKIIGIALRRRMNAANMRAAKKRAAKKSAAKKSAAKKSAVKKSAVSRIKDEGYITTRLAHLIVSCNVVYQTQQLLLLIPALPGSQ
jgi:hypothetical protein